jgi:hypothetical protein
VVVVVVVVVVEKSCPQLLEKHLKRPAVAAITQDAPREDTCRNRSADSAVVVLDRCSQKRRRL